MSAPFLIFSPEVAKQLIALRSICSRCTLAVREEPHLSVRDLVRASFLFSACTRPHLLAVWGTVGWERDCGVKGKHSCEVSRVLVQEDRKRRVAGCQDRKHTEPCLKPRRAPSTGAERGWAKGYKRERGWWWGGCWLMKKRRHAETFERTDCADHLKSAVCVGAKVVIRCELNC